MVVHISTVSTPAPGRPDLSPPPRHRPGVAAAPTAGGHTPPGERGAPVAADACDVFHMDPCRAARLREDLLGADLSQELAGIFRVLGDPTRVRMLDALSRAELCVCDLATLLGASQSAVSHQLRLLRGMRIVRQRRAGRMVFYRLDDRHIVTLFRQGLRHAEEGGHPGGRSR